VNRNTVGTLSDAGSDDITLSRQCDITQRQRLQLYIELFDTLNHVNLSKPNSTFIKSTFGVSLSDNQPTYRPDRGEALLLIPVGDIRLVLADYS
jgi:hypothetical protein